MTLGVTVGFPWVPTIRFNPRKPKPRPADIPVGLPSDYQPELTMSPSSGIVPFTVIASVTRPVVDRGTVAWFEWDWGDGTKTPPQPTALATHIYTKDGQFNATVTVTAARFG